MNEYYLNIGLKHVTNLMKKYPKDGQNNMNIYQMLLLVYAFRKFIQIRSIPITPVFFLNKISIPSGTFIPSLRNKCVDDTPTKN